MFLADNEGIIIDLSEKIGWFRDLRFRSLSSKPTFLSVIMGIVITFFSVFGMNLEKDFIIYKNYI